MSDQYQDQTSRSRIGHYLRIGIRKARLRETLTLAAAVCQQKLGVEEAYKRHGLKLEDVFRYLTMIGFVRSPPAEAPVSFHRELACRGHNSPVAERQLSD